MVSKKYESLGTGSWQLAIPTQRKSSSHRVQTADLRRDCAIRRNVIVSFRAHYLVFQRVRGHPGLVIDGLVACGTQGCIVAI